MTATAKRVLILGDACVDLMVRIPDRSGNAVHQQDPELQGGGTGANVAVGLARLGIPVALMGTIGDDGYGRYTRETLVADGIDVTHLYAVPDAFTTIALALIDSTGERTLFGWPYRGAAHTRFCQEQLDARTIQQAAWVHTTGMNLVEDPARETILTGLEIARAANIPVSLDVNIRLGFEDGRLPEHFLQTMARAISLSDYVLGSAAEEFCHLAPSGLSREEAAVWLSDGKRVAVARLGTEGTLLIAPKEPAVRVPIFSVEVVDTLGAGDAFNAGFIAASTEGRTLVEAVQWGNAVAALKITQVGARGTPSRAEVEALLANMP